MFVYSICYLVSFVLAQAGWYLPSGLALIGAALWLYWSEYSRSGSLVHLRGLFFLGFVGGQGAACLKLSRLAQDWSWVTWLCFFAAVWCFYLAFEKTGRDPGQSLDAGPFARRMGRGPAGVTVRWSGIRENRPRALADSGGLFVSIAAVTAVSLGCFLLEAAYLGYVPFFVRGVPHAYSYFHISGVHYFTVSCVLVPPMAVLYFLNRSRSRRGKDGAVAALTAVSLAIPILCVSRFQMIFGVGLAVMVYLVWNRRIPLAYLGGIAGALLAAYLILTVARSHDVEYLNGIFEMKNEHMPIFITQPYMYIANNYDNFNCLVEQLPEHTWGLRSLFPLWALTGMKFLFPGLASSPIYVTKEELTTLTILYDAYYDFGVVGVMAFSAALGAVCGYLTKTLRSMQNPAGLLLYAQMAMYMALSFFTTWFSNPATWFYLAGTAAVWFLCEYVRPGRRRRIVRRKRRK